jgi:heme-degrading monooxygenase HmoA
MKILKALLPIIVIAGICYLLFVVPTEVYTQPGKPAVARIWQGRVSTANGDAYEKYVKENGVPKMTSAAGNMGIQILRRPTSDAIEFVIISYWESRDAIKKVVGDDIEKAISLPRDSEFLLEPVTTVRHYQVAYSQK